MTSRRRAGCLALSVLGALAFVFASGMALWLALGAVAIGLAGVLVPASRPERFVRTALALGSVLVCLLLLEGALWLMERAAAGPPPEVAADAAPLPPDLPPEIRAKVQLMQGALVMPQSWRKRDLAKIPGTDPFVWHGVVAPDRRQRHAPRGAASAQGPRALSHRRGRRQPYLWRGHRRLMGLSGAARAGAGAGLPGRGPQSRRARPRQRARPRRPAALRA